MKSGVRNVSATIAARAAASAAAVALSSSLAWGTGGEGDGFANSAQVQVEGAIESECHFTTAPSNVAVAMATGASSTPAALGFLCNFAVSQLVTLKVASANGALKRNAGTETVAYAVTWDIQGDPDASGYPADGRTPAQFELQSGTVTTGQSGTFSVTITGATTGKPAGAYKDTLTFEISP